MSNNPQLDAIRERLARCQRDNRLHHDLTIYGSVYTHDVAYLLNLLKEPPAATQGTTQDEALAELLLEEPGAWVQTEVIDIEDLNERLQRGETVKISSATWFPICANCGKRHNPTVTGQCR